ncbi:GumC family protein [Amaricoccus solimangrovi]|uniref:Polysaccharide chain length determinant N-terminal domain-containing protein n=1 Tax=Amaricoccus solimangrovi TaxID=2589815 RepID=A0A501WTJ1_9RHOB|nr:Wzz/FepE/Etk N-terminal domain-containing protein [Amaricoccus solimangrovi]TPE49146.1 hypothetical protein FJM51_15865 [Amaricoccus solimangrovi]
MDGSEALTELDLGWREEPLGLARLAAMARRNLWLIGLGLVLGIGLGLGYIILAQPVYTASATIRVDLDRGGPADAATVMRLDNHVALIESDEMTAAVIRELGLDEIFDARPGRLQRTVQEIRGWFGLDTDPGPDPTPGAEAGTADARAEIIRVVGAALEVERIGNTAMIAVSYLSPSRRLAMEIANAYAESYVETARAQAQAVNDARVSRLQERMEDVRRKAESALETARRLRFQDGQPVSDAADLTRQVAQLKERLADSEIEAKTTRARLDVLSGVTDVAALPVGAQQTERIAELHGNLVATTRRLDLLRARDASAAAIAQLEGMIADLRESLTQELGQLSDSLELRLATVVATRSSLEGELRALMDYGRSASWSQLQAAEREARVYQEMYDGYRKDLETVYLQSTRPEVSVTSEALIPVSPSFPRYKAVLALACAFGLALGVGLALYREWSR